MQIPLTCRLIRLCIFLLIISCSSVEGRSALDDDVPREKAEKPKMNPPQKLPDVTHKVFLDVTISGTEPKKGRIVLGLFGKTAPYTVENFRSLCACDKGNGLMSGKPLCYRGTTFHRIIPNFMIQGGDITEGNGLGGESIYGGYFHDETFEVKHNKLYLLSMANKGPNTNNSQFFINTVKTSWLDNKNVVFGIVLSGFDVVDDIEAVGSNEGTPNVDVVIDSSGEIPMNE
mmetsp:Transcript_4709/g.10106  ORF Transcript_4709/g.10106 Transcript_4709/m.10106 type:complete len:230 (+) Transcript_4709:224-913(+)